MGNLENKRRYNKLNADKVNAYNREWRRKNPERSRAKWLKWAAANREKIKAWRDAFRAKNKDLLAIKRRDWCYSLANGQFDSMLKAQNGCCAACGEPFGQEKPRVDHAHSCCPGIRSCGKCVRGLIHHRCNSILGYVDDDPAKLLKLAEYLNGHNRC